MRYVGCKQRLLPFIHQTIKDHNIGGDTFCDLFAGTATVGHYFKQQGYRVISNDLLYTSYVMQQVKVAINRMPSFERLSRHLQLEKNNLGCYAQSVIDYLNRLDGVEGFIFHNYTKEGTKDQPIKRLYYTEENAKKIDVIRDMVAAWKQLSLIDHQEYYILLYALLHQASRCANTTGTMNSFLKDYAAQALRQIELKLPEITSSSLQHDVHCGDALTLLETLDCVDLLYLDPPYTSAQYAASYHLLETIARWDSPQIYGVTGRRDIQPLRSLFSRKRYALRALETILKCGRYNHLLMSYSDESLIDHQALMSLFRQYGCVSVSTRPLKRYNSLSQSDPRYNSKHYVEERLYYLKPYCTFQHNINGVQNQPNLSVFSHC